MLKSPAPDTTAATDLATDITAAKAAADVPAHAAAHAADHAAAQAAAIVYADGTLKLPFRPSSCFRAGSHCHRYFFVRLTICLSVRPSVRLHPTDSLSVRQTVILFFGPSVRQYVSLSVRTPVRPSTVRPSVNRRPSTAVRPSTVFIGGKR